MSRVTYNTEKWSKQTATQLYLFIIMEKKNVKDRKVVRIYLSAKVLKCSLTLTWILNLPELEDFLSLMTVVFYILVLCLMRKIGEFFFVGIWVIWSFNEGLWGWISNYEEIWQELVLWGSNGIPWDRVHHNLLKILIQKPNLVNLDQKPIHISRNIELNIKEFLRISQSSKIHHFISNPYKQFSSHHKNRHNISVHCREKRR